MAKEYLDKAGLTYLWSKIKAYIDSHSGSGGGASYTLSKSGSTITLTGTDGTSDSVTDDDTTYSAATTSDAGLMSSADKTKLNEVGTIYPDSTTYGSFSNKSVASSTTTQYWNSFTLPSTGTWIMHLWCDFPANATGYRYMGIIESAADGAELRTINASASSPGYANARARLSFTYIARITTTANLTFHIGVAQNSGSALTARFRYRAVKISN